MSKQLKATLSLTERERGGEKRRGGGGERERERGREGGREC